MKKKKIKDCSIFELIKFCKERNVTDCGDCPFFIEKDINITYCSMYSPSSINDSILEQEIDIPNNEMISKSELLAKLEELEENTRNISRTIKPNTPAKHNYHGRMKMIDIIITGILEDWREEPEPEPEIPPSYFRPM